MIAGRIGVAACAIGVVLFFAGLYGIAEQWSLYISEVGALVLLLGVIALLFAARAQSFSWPHPAVIVVSLLAMALYAYVHPFTDMAAGWWLWASIPYLFCIVVSCSSATHLPAVAGAVVALLFDAYVHYTVSISKSSTAALAYIYSPLWNTLVFAPTARLIAWLALRRRSSHAHDAP